MKFVYDNSRRLRKGNLFPLPFIDRITSSFLDHIFSSTGKKRVGDDKPILYFSTLFLGPGCLQLKSRISRLIKQCYPGDKL